MGHLVASQPGQDWPGHPGELSRIGCVAIGLQKGDNGVSSTYSFAGIATVVAVFGVGGRDFE